MNKGKTDNGDNALLAAEAKKALSTILFAFMTFEALPGG
jgi:hypothetical protein